MKKRYNIIGLPSKLELEVSEINEKFRLLYFSDYVIIELFDIQKNVKNVLDDEENIIETTVSYKKRYIKDGFKIIDEVEVPCKVDEWIDYDFDESKLDLIMFNHDSTTYLKSEIEILEEVIDNLLLLSLEV